MKAFKSICGTVALVAMSGAAWAQGLLDRQLSFDLPPQPLAQALSELAAQSNLRLVLNTDDVRGLMSERLTGTFTPRAAIERLLARSKLQFEFVDERTVEVRLVPERSDSEADKTELITVLGTYIIGAAPDSSPVESYSRDDIDRSGAATVEQFMRTVPQNLSSVDASSFAVIRGGSNLEAASNTGFGSGINLRGLGSGSTLVLLNGTRMAPGGGSGLFTDVSMIPLSAIGRVDVLTDGASSLYGADAVGGVVNFVLREDYNGAETTVRRGDTTDGGSAQTTISQLLGASWTGGNGMLVYEHDQQSPLFAADRDFITPQTGPFMVLPRQRRNSAVATVSQNLSSSLRVFGRGLYSDRSFDEDQSTFGLYNTKMFGSNIQLGGVVGAAYSFGSDWRAQATANYMRNELDPTSITDTLAGQRINTFATRQQSEIQSFDVRVDGQLFPTPGGTARFSAGSELRTEKFSDYTPPPGRGVGTDLKRDVFSLYGEVLLPLVSSTNARVALRRFDISLSARRDDYQDEGASTNPKIGIVWSPVSGLNVRGTYAKSFRVAPLAQESETVNSGALFRVPGATPTSPPVGLLYFSGGNALLEPERSKSQTFGLDFSPDRYPDLKLSATWFRIRYEDRIAAPPLQGSVFELFLQLGTLGPFVNTAPTPAQIQEVFSRYTISDFAGLGPGAVEAIFDNRLQNIAVSRQSGADFSVSKGFEIGRSTLGLTAGGTYLIDYKFKSTPEVPEVSLLNTAYNPLRMRMRGGVTWGIGDFDTSLFVNYADSYENNLLVPAGTVSSWTTADLTVSFRPQTNEEGWWSGFGFSLYAQNLTNEAPPALPQAPSLVGLGFNYDPVNASPRGRFISLQLTKQW